MAGVSHAPPGCPPIPHPSSPRPAEPVSFLGQHLKVGGLGPGKRPLEAAALRPAVEAEAPGRPPVDTASIAPARTAAAAARRSQQFDLQGGEIFLGKVWEKYSFHETIRARNWMATSTELLRSSDPGRFPRNGESQRPVRGVANADSRRDQRLCHGPQPSSRICNDGEGLVRVQAIVGRRHQFPAPSTGIPQARNRTPALVSLSGLPTCNPRVTAIASTPATGSSARSSTLPASPFRLAGNVQAEVHAVNRIDISVPGQPEQHLVARRWSAMCVRRRVRRIVVRAEIRLHLHNPAGDDSCRAAMDKQLAQQSRRNQLRAVRKERPARPAGPAAKCVPGSRIGMNSVSTYPFCHSDGVLHPHRHARRLVFAPSRLQSSVCT